VVVLGRADEVELHPDDVVPASAFPSHTAVHTSVLETEGSMKVVAGLVGLSDTGEGPPASLNHLMKS
jgi:hypothetical protein